ncbi:MAG: hypothetical protein H5T99_00350 [Moorella sp. (in: Bacteria)]|nr:hypothetical protein [Moorella sp. (in: firmicutes)]
MTAMLCFTPLMALFWSLNRNVPAFAIWLGELGSNALMPVAHALVLCLILGIVDVKSVTDGTWFQVLVAVMVFVPLTETIRNSIQGLFVRWAGVNEAGTAGRVTAAALGFGGLLSLGRLAGTVTGKNLPGGGSVPSGPAPGGPSGPGSGGLTSAPTTAPNPISSGAGRPGGPAPMTMPGGTFGLTGPPGQSGYTGGPAIFTSPPGNGSAGVPSGNIPSEGQPAGAGSGASGQPASQPSAWKARLGQVATRYGRKAADGLVKAGAFTAGAVAGGAVRAGLGAVPGLAPAGERLGGLAGRGVAYAVRGTAGLAVMGGRLLQDMSKKDEEPKIFNPKEAGKTLHSVATGRAPLSAAMQAPIYHRPNAPKYQASIGGLDKRTA